MKFVINNRTWEIIELSQEEMRQHIIDYKYDGEPQQGRYYGQTYYDEQKIYIDKDLHPEQKRQTKYGYIFKTFRKKASRSGRRHASRRNGRLHDTHPRILSGGDGLPVGNQQYRSPSRHGRIQTHTESPHTEQQARSGGESALQENADGHLWH